MKNFLSFFVELIKKAPKWTKITFVTMLAILFGIFSFIYVSCGSLDVKDFRWQYGEGSMPPTSGTPLDIIPST